MKETLLVHEVLRVAKDLYAAQEQCNRLLHAYKKMLGNMPDAGGTNGVWYVVDRDRTLWRLQWNVGYPTVDRVAALDVLDDDDDTQRLPQENIVAADEEEKPQGLSSWGRPWSPPDRWRDPQR